MSTDIFPPYCCSTHHTKLNGDSNGLACAEGCESIAIIKDIPRFVDNDNYADAFGKQWIKHRLTQLDSYTGLPITRDRLKRCLGKELWSGLEGKVVLECGCGAGRFTEILLEQGAYVMSVDLSEAVEANGQNFSVGEKHKIIQANITQLPFESQQFDIVLCLGVVQHTPDSIKTIDSLFQHVKPKGALVIDHYKPGLDRFTRIAFLFRMVLKRLPPQQSLFWVDQLVNFFFPLHKMMKNIRIGNTLLNRISPLNTYFHVYPELNDMLQKEWATLDTHDALTDWYKRYKTTGQINKIMANLGIEKIWCEYGGNGVEARGERK